jgi:hypothetical protein
MVVADANGVMSTQALGIAGSGTLNRLAKFTAAGTVGDSGIYQDPSDNRIVIDNNYDGTSRLQINNIDSGANAKSLVIALTTGNRYLSLLSHGQNATGSIAGLSNAGLQELQAGSDSTALLINAAGSIPIVFANGSSITERMRITPDGDLLVNTTVNAGYRLDVNGTARATAFFTSSDKRKKDIISQDGDLATYQFKGDDQIHYGYIAQDMEDLYPNQVSTDNDGMMSLNYIEILVKKVHDLESKLKRHGLD